MTKPWSADRPELNGELLPALNVTGSLRDPEGSLSLNPAQAYLLSLNSPRSRQTMRSFLGIIARILGATRLETCQWGAMRRHHVQAIIALLQDADKAPATINTYLSALKGVATEAWMMKQLDAESCEHIRRVRNVRGSRLPRGRALPREEIRALFGVCDADKKSLGLRDAAILGVMFGGGLRRSEVVGLDLASLMMTDQALRVLGKGNKERIAYLPAGSWHRLLLWVDQIRGEVPGPLFTRIRRHDDVTDHRMTDQAVYHILGERQRQAGIEKCAPHDIRRTFATTMLDNGEDLITVRDAMGHASVTTTQQYDRRGDERLRRARDKLDFD
ncbi:tyrosine-type recombinase/integrase [Scandinavium sp. NPDC088450]|uniref:tyrosine-type recombinase/integrase n=1 Tax=Scandinavium sp. NPDC088450 TaxID=3364514 RepID=UPI00384F57A0